MQLLLLKFASIFYVLAIWLNVSYAISRDAIYLDSIHTYQVFHHIHEMKHQFKVQS